LVAFAAQGTHIVVFIVGQLFDCFRLGIVTEYIDDLVSIGQEIHLASEPYGLHVIASFAGDGLYILGLGIEYPNRWHPSAAIALKRDTITLGRVGIFDICPVAAIGRGASLIGFRHQEWLGQFSV